MKKIIFLCVANSARSQIAEGLAKHILRGKADIYSAGSYPSGHIMPSVYEVMDDIDIDIRDQYSKGLNDVPINEADYIITLCKEECPFVDSKAEKLHWPIQDPAINNMGFFEVRNEISHKIKEFSKKL